jgi:hypothetical protein
VRGENELVIIAGYIPDIIPIIIKAPMLPDIVLIIKYFEAIVASRID